MNKFLIPIILISIVTISGIFAFVPIEQASTIHSTVVSGSLLSSEIQGQDRAVSVSANFSHGNSQQVIVIPAAASVTLTGSAVISSSPNDLDGSQDVLANTAQIAHECYLQSTGASSTANNGFRILNTTGGGSNSTTIGSTNMPAGHGIILGQSNGTGVPGVCTATIVLESWDD